MSLYVKTKTGLSTENPEWLGEPPGAHEDKIVQTVDTEALVVDYATSGYPDLTALESLELFAKLYGVADPGKRAMELLEAVEL